MEAPRPTRRTKVRELTATETFRPCGWLRAAVYFGVAFWVFVFFCLVALEGATNEAYLGVLFFVSLFTALGVVYNNTSIEATTDALIVRSITSFRLVPYRDVLRVDVNPGLLQTNYAVLARQGFFHFTNLFAGHERLMRLIVERARLGQL
jgi:pheromone shutdown protein TraB